MRNLRELMKKVNKKQVRMVNAGDKPSAQTMRAIKGQQTPVKPKKPALDAFLEDLDD